MKKTEIAQQITLHLNTKEDFLEAWKKGVKLYPKLFRIKTEDGNIDSAKDQWDLCPLDEDFWDNEFFNYSRGEKAFLASMLSFYNSYRAQILLKVIGREDICSVTSILDSERKSILVDLINTYRGW